VQNGSEVQWFVEGAFHGLARSSLRPLVALSLYLTAGSLHRYLSHLVAMRTFSLPRALPPKILGIVRGPLTNIKSRNLHSIARNR
jgi:hypothetical protein